MNPELRTDVKRALHCLYIAVDEAVATDVDLKVNAYINALEGEIRVLTALIIDNPSSTPIALGLAHDARKMVVSCPECGGVGWTPDAEGNRIKCGTC